MKLTPADGYAERDAVIAMLDRLPKRKRRRTVAAGKAHDTSDFIARTGQRVFTPRRPEHVEPHQRDRRSHDPPPEARGQPTDPETDRGALRVDQDHRRWTQAPLHRPTTEPGLVLLSDAVYNVLRITELDLQHA
jgi:hypothetical protein